MFQKCRSFLCLTRRLACIVKKPASLEQVTPTMSVSDRAAGGAGGDAAGDPVGEVAGGAGGGAAGGLDRKDRVTTNPALVTCCG
jgi:hypothetical protein